MSSRRAFLLIGLLGVGAITAAFLAGRPGADRPGPGGGRVPEVGGPSPGVDTIGGLPRSQFHIDHDRFLPATDPPVVAGAAQHFLADGDEVYGLLLGGHARAYPIRMIAYHHVVNDTIEGVPIAVTY